MPPARVKSAPDKALGISGDFQVIWHWTIGVCSAPHKLAKPAGSLGRHYQTRPKNIKIDSYAVKFHTIKAYRMRPRMNAIMKILRSSICVVLLAGFVAAQQDNPPVQPMDQTPVFRVNVVSRTTKAVNYRHRGGSTTVDMAGTDLMPEIKGKAKVDSKAGRLQINVDLSRLEPASRVGPQYLTYVLWAITPEGRANNLGEIVPDDWERAALASPRTCRHSA